MLRGTEGGSVFAGIANMPNPGGINQDIRRVKSTGGSRVITGATNGLTLQTFSVDSRIKGSAESSCLLPVSDEAAVVARGSFLLVLMIFKFKTVSHFYAKHALSVCTAHRSEEFRVSLVG
jgi:hypothetical protein